MNILLLVFYSHSKNAWWWPAVSWSTLNLPHLKTIKHSPYWFFRSLVFLPTIFFNHRNVLPFHLLSPTIIFQKLKFQETLLDYFAISLCWINAKSPGGKFHVRLEEPQCCSTTRRGAGGVEGNINAHHIDSWFDQVEDMKINMYQRVWSLESISKNNNNKWANFLEFNQVFFNDSLQIRK